MFIIQSELSEPMKVNLMQHFNLKDINTTDYGWELMRSTFIQLFCTSRGALDDPNVSYGQQSGGKGAFRRGYGGRTFCIIEECDYGDADGWTGYWVEDDETGQEGLLDETEDILWCNEEGDFSSWYGMRFRGRTVRRGARRKGKGKGKSKRGKESKGRRRFHRRDGGRTWYGEEESDLSEWSSADSYYEKGDAMKGKGKSKSKGKGKPFGKGKGKPFGAASSDSGKGDAAANNQDAWYGKSKGKGKRKGKNRRRAYLANGDANPELTWEGDLAYECSWDTAGTPSWVLVTTELDDTTDSWESSEWSQPQEWGSANIAQHNPAQWDKPEEAYSFVSHVFNTNGRTDAFQVFVGETEEQSNFLDQYALLQRKNCPAPLWQGLINLKDNPTYCILDIGCTRCMGSYPAVEAFIKAGEPLGIKFEWQKCNTKMSFANSDTETLEWCVQVTWPTMPPISTTIDVHMKGNVPILLSLSQMMNLEMTFVLQSDAVYCDCDALGYWREPLEFSTSRHVVLDLARLRYNPGVLNNTFGTVVNSSGDKTTQVFR
jgi:hypothetical protein